jgi:hypothetical protein
MSISSRHRAGIRIPLAVALLSLFGLGGIAAAAPAEAAAPPPGLSVTISDGGAKLASHTDVKYTASVVNKGSTPITATLVVTVPSYARPRLTTGTDGTVSGSDVVWPLTVQLGKATGAPLIRAAVASTIRGVVDPSTVHAAPHVVRAPSAGPVWVGYLAGGLVLAALIGLAILLWMRRKRRTPIGHLR